MNAKLVTVLVGGVLLGLGTAFLVKPPEAKAQKERVGANAQAVSYEFKVTVFAYSAPDAEKKLTELAADRWEYLGVINGGGTRGGQSLIAFRRPKR